MKYDSDIHHRRSLRWQGYDYASPGYYFVTVCTQEKECLFGSIVNNDMQLNDAGRMIQTVWHQLPDRFAFITTDEFIVMPNHIHGILAFRSQPANNEPPIDRDKHPDGERPEGTLPETIGRIMQAFKSICTHDYITGVKQQGWQRFSGRLWQRNFWERVIRNELELMHIREYIHYNPAGWQTDKLYR